MSGKVTTSGSGVSRAVPDGLELRFVVSFLATTAPAAIEAASGSQAALRALIDELDLAGAIRSTTGIRVNPEREYRDNTYHHAGYRAVIPMELRLGDVARAGTLIQRAVSIEGCSVEQQRWLIDSDNPARMKACALAAEDAKRRADAYASALGTRVAGVRSVSETVSRWEDPMQYRSVVAGEGVQHELVVEAGELNVTATVEVIFELTPA